MKTSKLEKVLLIVVLNYIFNNLSKNIFYYESEFKQGSAVNDCYLLHG